MPFRFLPLPGGWRVLLFGLALATLAACADAGGAGGMATPANREIIHQRFTAGAGGAYPDARIQDYVASVGKRLAAKTEAPAGLWRFTVLDHESPNGVASANGDIYITRGFLALLDDESELAAVLGHEMGHVVLRHAARSVERERQELAPVLAAMQQKQLDRAFQLTVEGLQRLKAYSRNDELEADRYAVRIAGLAGYPREGVERMLVRLQDYDRFVAERSGRLSGTFERKDPFASHPGYSERLATVRAELQAQRAAPIAVAAAASPGLPDVLEGLLVGVDPRLGVIRNGRLLHAGFGVALNVPTGYIALPDRRIPGALSREGAIWFQCNPQPAGPDMVTWMRSQMQRPEVRAEVKPFPGTAFDAASIASDLRNERGTGEFRMVAMRVDSQVCTFIVLVPPQLGATGKQGVEAALRSVSRLSDADRASIQPMRLFIVKANAGDTLESLARRYQVAETAVVFLPLLNGIEPRQRLEAGRAVKLVRRE